MPGLFCLSVFVATIFRGSLALVSPRPGGKAGLVSRLPEDARQPESPKRTRRA